MEDDAGAVLHGSDLGSFFGGDLLYSRSFITEVEEAQFLRLMRETGGDAGKPSAATLREQLRGTASTLRWVNLRGRRLLNIGGAPGVRPMVPEPIPKWVMEPFATRVSALRFPTADGGGPHRGLFHPDAPPNHVLINEYRNPEGFIMPHEDGPIYEPTVAIVSLQSALPLVFTRKQSALVDGVSGRGLPDTLSVFLEPRSLVVFRGALYKEYLHGIAAAEADVLAASTCINYAMVADDVRKAMPAEMPVDGIPNDALVSVRGNVRTSVTYRRVLEVAQRPL